MWLAFYSGIVGILTPAAFPLLVISWFLFEKLSDSNLRHILNVLLVFFGALVAAVLFLFSFTSTGNLPSPVNQTAVVLVANVPLLVMSVYVLATTLKVAGFDAQLAKIKWLSWSISISYGVKLFLACLSIVGPLIGALLASRNEAPPDHRNMIILGGTLGFELPVVVALALFGMFYGKVRNGKIWTLVQSIALVWLIAITFHQVYMMF